MISTSNNPLEDLSGCSTVVRMPFPKKPKVYLSSIDGNIPSLINHTNEIGKKIGVPHKTIEDLKFKMAQMSYKSAEELFLKHFSLFIEVA